MTIPYTKYAGAGNDFVVIDAVHNPVELDDQAVVRLVQAACSRSEGIGSDGLILLAPSGNAEFTMRFYNPDGSYGALCGNGARCAVQAAKDFGIIERTDPKFEVLGDINRAEILKPEQVRVYVQRPRAIKINFSLRVARNIFLTTNYVDVGSQHAVVFWDDIAKIGVHDSIEDFRINYWGPTLRWHIDFAPVGVNANFAEIREDEQGKYIRIRTFERGVEGETLACGTGCLSTAIAAHATKRLDLTSIRLLTQSGEFVTVRFDMIDGKAHNLSLEGSAMRGRSGTIQFDPSTSRLAHT